jgi:glutamine amidotransferase-like uncharacterized protein
LDDARAFLLTAEAADNADVVASNAILAAIAASDVLCCLALGERPNSGNHVEASELLERVETKHAQTLRRCLALKSKAAYSSQSVSTGDAGSTVRWAVALVDAAEAAMLRAG